MSNIDTVRVGGTDYAIEDPTKANASQIATIESGATASAAHVAGEFIYHSGTLYVVTAPISAGDTLTVGTNIQATTVGSELKTIKTDLSDKAGKNQISNRNLLDNAWFTVNQRGLLTYPSSNIQIVDRWKQRGGTTQTVVTNNGITITNTRTDGATWIANQTFTYDEGMAVLNGKSCTLSIMMGDGAIYSCTSAIGTPSMQFTHNNVTVSMQMEYKQSEDICRVLVWIETASASISIRAMKLEMGEVSTLAMDTIPNYAEELLKCQRYYVQYKNNLTGETTFLTTGFALSASDIRFSVALPVPMRAKPSISYSSLSDIAISKTYYGASTTPTSVSIGGTLFANYAVLSINGGTISVSAGDSLQMYLKAGGFIAFSAEL